MRRKSLLAIMLAASMALTACKGGDSSSKTSDNSSKDDKVTSATTSTATQATTQDSTDTKKPEVKKENMAIKLGEYEVKSLGRTVVSEDALWLAMSGTGLEFSFTGKKLEVIVLGDATASGTDKKTQARVGVFVNDKRVSDHMINEKEKKITVVDNAESTTSTVKIIKLSESANSVCGVQLPKLADGEIIKAVPEKTKRIEFIGDSITCGYGVDDEVKENHFSTETEDFSKTYAYKSAQSLDAEVSIFAASGYGIISGYSGSGNKVANQTIPQYYDKLGFSYQSIPSVGQPQKKNYDFGYQPDVIVINLGTNDNTYVKKERDTRAAEYTTAYIEFIKKIRTNNPNSTILCTMGIMGAELYNEIEQVVEKYSKDSGDKNVYSMKFDQQNMELDGIAADWHPSEKTHEKAATKLTEEIKKIMKW